MSALITFIKLSRPYNALLPVGAIVAGYLVSLASDVSALLLTILLFVLLHGVVTIWNDMEDEATDVHNGIKRIMVVRRAGRYKTFRYCLVILAAASLLASIWLPLILRLLFVAYLIIGWLYNAAPARLSRRPLGSMVIMFSAYGLIPVALGAGLGNWYWQVIVLALGWSTSRLSLSLMKDYKDAAGDAKAVKKTFLLVYGHNLTARLSFGLLAAGLTAIIAAVISYSPSLPVIIAIILLASWLLIERARLFGCRDYSAMHAVFRDGLRYQLLFDGAVIIWLITL